MMAGADAATLRADLYAIKRVALELARSAREGQLLCDTETGFFHELFFDVFLILEATLDTEDFSDYLAWEGDQLSRAGRGFGEGGAREVVETARRYCEANP